MKKSSKVEVKKVVPTLVTKRFVIKKNLIGKGEVITFKSYDGVEYIYDHDVVYNQLKSRFDSMPCFAKYKSYTQTFDLPAFVKALPTLV
jgi:hypothetical protein